MSRGTIEALYEQVRSAMPAAASFAPTTLQVVSPGIRVLALRTPTLPPAAHTNVYLVGPDVGPVAVVDPGSPYPEQQAVCVAGGNVGVRTGSARIPGATSSSSDGCSDIAPGPPSAARTCS